MRQMMGTASNTGHQIIRKIESFVPETTHIL